MCVRGRPGHPVDEIELLTPDGARLDTGGLPNPYSTRTSAVIPVSLTDVAEVGVAVGAGIPSSYIGAVSQLLGPGEVGQVVMSLQAVGRTAGGLSLKTIPLQWPISLCRSVVAPDAPPNCLFSCNRTDTMLPMPTGCIPGQDGRFFCPFAPQPDGGMP